LPTSVGSQKNEKIAAPNKGGGRSSVASGGTLKGLANAFKSFCGSLTELVPDMFKTKKHDSSHHARRYLGGLVSGSARKNMSRMDEHLTADDESDYEGMQHFLSASPWDESKVWDFIAGQADHRLGDTPDSCLVIDESAITKKGVKSVGVGRQHNGRLGKQDNCQVGVFSVLNCNTFSAVVGARLFLTKEWIDDPERCQKSGVPKEQIRERTKIDLARELVEQAEEQGLRFACVGVDAFYGRDSTFLEWMDGRSLVYCADIPNNALIFETKPEGETRPKEMRKAATRADALAAKYAAGKGVEITVREGENGQVRGEFWTRRVWVWPAEREAPRECWAIVRRMSDGTLKISLSNAPAGAAMDRLAKWQASRYFVERTFQDAKSHAGMADYEARGWKAWHHHMALVGLAMLFMMQQRLLLAEAAPLLSARDIVDLLDWHLARPRTAAEALAAVARRHEVRERQALAAQKLDRKRAGLPKIRKMRRPTLPK
jgi:SRSO17 transposase